MVKKLLTEKPYQKISMLFEENNKDADVEKEKILADVLFPEKWIKIAGHN
jgi:hypothetical protein